MSRSLSPASEVILGMRIDPVTSCWNWQERTGSKGYPRLWQARSITTMVRRLSWLLWVDPEWPGPHRIFTTCDNKLCVNPEHLTDEKAV